MKVHNLPDHVFFSHAQHVNTGQIECETCHGPVQEMDIVKQYASLSMGWCLDCHRNRKVPLETNNYYALFEELQIRLSTGKIDSVTSEQLGGTDCQKCHY